MHIIGMKNMSIFSNIYNKDENNIKISNKASDINTPTKENFEFNCFFDDICDDKLISKIILYPFGFKFKKFWI